MSNHEPTAKLFALQLGSVISLYLVVSFALVLIFGLINLFFPQPGDAYYTIESYSSSVRLGIAMLVVFFPTYIFLTRASNNHRRQDASGAYLSFTKWLVYLSLLVAGAALLIDLVVVIMAFLEGELTSRFLLKVVAVLVIVGMAFVYYLKDAQGYWVTHKQQSQWFAVTASVLVLILLGLGATQIDPPAQVREMKIDTAQIRDLESIQWQIEEYYFLNQALPTDLSALADVPTAPEGRDDYTYNITEDGFELCATFKAASNPADRSVAIPQVARKDQFILNAYSWDYKPGRTCFLRVINPDFGETVNN